jgi:hypothetical protein
MDLEKLYHTARWRRTRARQLAQRPLCAFCQASRGIVTPAEVCDHVEPHHGDLAKFWRGPFQSLCVQCHNSLKRDVEARGFYRGCGLDGYPLDKQNHPFYRVRATVK